MRWATATCTAMLVAALAASPAVAAFPGANGMLAVAPLHGPGLMLMSSQGTRQHRVCPSEAACTVANTPRWAPDGRAIAFSLSSGRGMSLIYDDGSCLDCQPFGAADDFGSAGASRLAFTSIPALLSAVSGGDLVEFGSDGLQKQTVLSGHVSDAVWSAGGELAVVRSAQVWAGRPGHLRSLGPGGSPSWASGGLRLAVVRRGWVTLLGVRHRFVKRLARGRSPAFSPDGKWIAFIAAGHRLSTISSRGGRARRVGRIGGRYVDWQPIPAQQPGCGAPPGSATVASSSTAIMTADSSPAPVPGNGLIASAYMGCQLSTGRARLLSRYDFQSYDNTISASQFATAGDFAAFVEDDADPHYGGSKETVHVFDLNTGAPRSTLGGEQAGCEDYSYDCSSVADQLVLNAQGFTAVHTTVIHYGASTATEQIAAADSTGVHVEDSASIAHPLDGPPAPLLTALQLSGNTLSWQHAGAPESAQLH